MKKIPIWKNVVLIVSIVLVIVIATFSWFVSTRYAVVNPIDLGVKKASYIRISGDDGATWSHHLEIQDNISSLKEITGDGINFYAPTYETKVYGNKVLTGLNKLDDTAKNDFYYEKSFSVRVYSEDSYIFSLSPESKIFPVESEYPLESEYPVESEYVEAKKKVEEANKDSQTIAGAVRVAFFETTVDGDTYKDTLKFIWAPNSLTDSTENGNPEDRYVYLDGNEVTQEVLTDNFAYGYDETNSFLWTNEEITSDNLSEWEDLVVLNPEAVEENEYVLNDEIVPPILDFDSSNSQGIMTKTFKIKVWLEGQDRECVQSAYGGKIDMSLKFNAVKVN